MLGASNGGSFHNIIYKRQHAIGYRRCKHEGIIRIQTWAIVRVRYKRRKFLSPNGGQYKEKFLLKNQDLKIESPLYIAHFDTPHPASV